MSEELRRAAGKKSRRREREKRAPTNGRGWDWGSIAGPFFPNHFLIFIISASGRHLSPFRWRRSFLSHNKHSSRHSKLPVVARPVTCPCHS